MKNLVTLKKQHSKTHFLVVYFYLFIFFGLSFCFVFYLFIKKKIFFDRVQIISVKKYTLSSSLCSLFWYLKVKQKVPWAREILSNQFFMSVRPNLLPLKSSFGNQAFTLAWPSSLTTSMNYTTINWLHDYFYIHRCFFSGSYPVRMRFTWSFWLPVCAYVMWIVCVVKKVCKWIW